MALVNLEVRRPQHNYTYYETTNESLPALRQVTSKVRFKKVAAISSGGEVPLTVLLPRVNEQLVAVDHAMASLAWAFFKVYLLKNFKTIPEFKRWLKEVTPVEFDNMRANAVQAFPLEARGTHWEFRWATLHGTTVLDILKKIWLDIPDSRLRVAKERLDLVKFVHGDLFDITPDGPFDLVYVSNALNHIKHIYLRPLEDAQLKALLTPNGKLLTTVSYDNPDTIPTWPKYKAIKAAAPTSRWGHLEWEYALRQPPKES